MRKLWVIPRKKNQEILIILVYVLLYNKKSLMNKFTSKRLLKKLFIVQSKDKLWILWIFQIFICQNRDCLILQIFQMIKILRVLSIKKIILIFFLLLLKSVYSVWLLRRIRLSNFLCIQCQRMRYQPEETGNQAYILLIKAWLIIS